MNKFYDKEGGESCGMGHLDSSEVEGQYGGSAKSSMPYVVDGKKYKMKFGSRRQVYNGTAYQTKGNLKQNDIKKNKQERFVSVKKSLMATKEQRLLKYGYGAKKGKFGYVRVKPVRTAKRRKSASVRKKSASVSAVPASVPAAALDLAAPAVDDRVLTPRRVGIIRRMKKTKRRSAKRRSAKRRVSRGVRKKTRKGNR